MKFLNGGNVVRVAPDEIIVTGRLRRVSDVQVQNLITMAEDTGITTPIHLRKVEGKLHLIDGAHRLAAAKLLGLTEIAALVVECRQDEARAMEASNNLGAARMTPLQTAVFVASWKRDYYALHPDRKPGVFKGNQYKEKVVSAQNALTTSIAESLGIQRRQAFKMLAVGERLTADEVAALDTAGIHVGLNDLAALAKIAEPDERAAVVQRLAATQGRGTAKARKAWQAEQGKAAPPKDPVQESFNALLKAWDRAPLAVKKRFCLERHQSLWEAKNKGVPLVRWSEASDE